MFKRSLRKNGRRMEQGIEYYLPKNNRDIKIKNTLPNTLITIIKESYVYKKIEGEHPTK